MLKLTDDWEFNVLGIYNFRKPGPFDTLFNFVRDNHQRVEGDIVEAGVFRGSSLIAMGIMLKELGSEKKIYGFDSFSGFPPIYHTNDALEKFEDLHAQGCISDDHLNAVRRNLDWRRKISAEPINSGNISSSGNFSATSLELVKKKIEIIGLDNIILMEGSFLETMKKTTTNPKNIMACLMDCDIYESYRVAFDFVWPRLSPNGIIFLDEYYSLKFPGARIATDEFVKNSGGTLIQAPKKLGDFERWYLTKE